MKIKNILLLFSMVFLMGIVTMTNESPPGDENLDKVELVSSMDIQTPVNHVELQGRELHDKAGADYKYIKVEDIDLDMETVLLETKETYNLERYYKRDKGEMGTPPDIV